MIEYTLFPHQIEALKYLKAHDYSILGDAMGLGKTLVAIEAIKKAGLRALVVCPAFLKETWAQEIRKFSDLKPVIFQKTTKYDSFDVAIITYGMLKEARHLFKVCDFIVADEVHYLKNIEAQRTMYFHEYLRAYKPERFLGLSGTAIKNRVPEFYSLLRLCSYNPKGTSGENVMKAYPDYWSFCQAFCHVTQFRIKNRTVTKFEGHKNVDRLRELLKDKYIRRRTSEVLDLPPIIRKDIVLAPHQVDNVLLEAWKEQGKHFITHKVANAKAKTSHTIKYIKELFDQGEKPLLIFSDHVDPVFMIYDGLPKYNLRTVTGQTPMAKRDEYRVEFQEGKIDGIIATIGSLSVGVTLTRARNVIFNDLCWVPADIAQAEKRIHRIGQEHTCVVHRIFYGQVDGMIGKELDKKIETLVEVL